MTFPEMQRQSNFWPISHVGITLNVNRAMDGHKLRRRYNWLLYDSRDVIRLISARRAIREGSNRYQQTRAQDIGG